jgi:hypothetical protein
MTNSSLTIEEEILLLQEKGKDAPLSIEEILHTFSRNGQALFIIFLCLPFCQPLQIPGLSTPFGLAIAFMGLKIAFSKYAWLPKVLLAKTITPATVQKITAKVLIILKKMSRWVHPRMVWLCHSKAFKIANGLLITALGLLLALPLPIPLSNLMAAWAIFFLGLGLLKEDGIFIILGYLLSLITVGFFIATIFLIKFIF